MLAIADGYGVVLAESLAEELEALGLAVAAIEVSTYDYFGPYDEAIEDAVAHVPDAIVLVGFDETRFVIDRLADAGLMPAP